MCIGQNPRLEHPLYATVKSSVEYSFSLPETMERGLNGLFHSIRYHEFAFLILG